MTFPSTPSVLLIGCGKMGEAILSGWLACDEGAAHALTPQSFTVVEHTPDRASVLARSYGVDTALSVHEAPQADIVIVAVKPQAFGDVLLQMRETGHVRAGEAPPLVVSIAAGIPTSEIEQALGEGAHVVRVMPNLPLQVGSGASAIAGGAHATQEEVELVRELFAALGFSCVVDEGDIDAVCALSGGGPAYFSYLVELLAEAGEEAGLDHALALELAQSTLIGTGQVLAASKQSARELRQAVCSPGGTTLAALEAMDSHGIKEAVHAGVASAIVRAKELSRC